jgi:glyoxylase-like metal-dependent hydrolase (beta-lactamase superfamily II)
MMIESAAVAPFFKNGFVLGCERTRDAVLIDPGDEVDQLLAWVERERLEVQAILLTHAHVDHVSGVGRAKRALGVPIYLHRADQFLYDQAASHGRLFGLDVEQPPPVDIYYASTESGSSIDGQPAFSFGDYDVFVHHTPGHCPGGVCLQVGRRGERGGDLFVGDTLFAGSIGRTDLPGGDYPTLLRSITDVLFTFGDDARVYSGHGPVTTIGKERQTNPFVLEWVQNMAKNS